MRSYRSSTSEPVRCRQSDADFATGRRPRYYTRRPCWNSLIVSRLPSVVYGFATMTWSLGVDLPRTASLVAVALALSGGHSVARALRPAAPRRQQGRARIDSDSAQRLRHLRRRRNVTVHVGEDGLVVVDTGSSEKAGSLLDAIKAISPAADSLVINTSADLDHVGRQRRHRRRRNRAQPGPFGPATTPPCSRTRTSCCA